MEEEEEEAPRRFNIDVNPRRFQSDATSRASLAARWCHQLGSRKARACRAPNRCRVNICALRRSCFCCVARAESARDRAPSSMTFASSVAVFVAGKTPVAYASKRIPRWNGRYIACPAGDVYPSITWNCGLKSAILRKLRKHPRTLHRHRDKCAQGLERSNF